MHKILISFVVLLLFLTAACSLKKSNIISYYYKNENVFLDAAHKKDFKSLEKLTKVKKVYMVDGCADISIGPGYRGIYYSRSDSLFCFDWYDNTIKFEKNGKKYHYKEKSGDNEFYFEELGNHFFYYEFKY